MPPLAEQRRIAAILDAADALRQKRRQALRLLDQLSQAIFIEMFGDPVTSTGKFPVVRLDEVCELENGDRSSKYPSGSDIQDSGVLFLSTRNIISGRLDLSDAQYISHEKFATLSRGKARRGDILITLRGTLGSCCVFDCAASEAFINAQLLIVRPGSTLTASSLL